MKCLILYASIGGGHKQAAETLKTALEARGHHVVLKTFYNELSKRGGFINKSLEKLIMTPRVFSRFYNLSNNRFGNYMVLPLLLKSIFRLRKIIDEQDIDMVISTHAFAATTVARLKRRGKRHFPLVQVVTDFTAHGTHIAKEVDAYVVAGAYTAQSFIAKGVPAAKLHPLGIPVRPHFYNKVTRALHDPINILVMGGSLGDKQMATALDYMVSGAKRPQHIEVICGRNESLRSELAERYADNPLVEILGFCTDIDERMDRADLLITKPGGITSTEALVKELPMLIPFSYGGHEMANTTFLTEEGVALKPENLAAIPAMIEELLANPASYEDMLAATRRINASYSIDALMELFESLASSVATAP